MILAVLIYHRLYNQRFILKSHKSLNAGILILLLQDYFPGLIFLSNQNFNKLSIKKYVVNKHGKWTLNIEAMSKSKDANIACLFPKNISMWNEAKARGKYGSANIIRFFIDLQNNMFLDSFSKVKNILLDKIDNKYISSSFLDKVKFNKPVWEIWDFSSIVLHKMRHNPPSIYEAFNYFAHKQYTLLGFSTPVNQIDTSTGELIKDGFKLLSEKIKEYFPEVNNFNIDEFTHFFELVQETLESVPKGNSVYEPTDMEIILNQIKSRMANLFRKKFDENTDLYSPSNRKTINNHIIKAKKTVNDENIRKELQKVQLSGTSKDKINILYRIISIPEIRKNYSHRELEIINGLFLKQNTVISLDKELINDDGSFTGHDLLKDEKHIDPIDRFIWTSFFTDVFKNELDKDKLEKFIEYLPGHFSQYPFDLDSERNIKITKYSRKILFSIFCSVLGIIPEKELWKPFLVLIKRVINNINDS
jgi:hypothetical protein